MTWWNTQQTGIQPSRKFDFQVKFIVEEKNTTQKFTYRVKDLTLPSLQRNVETVLIGNKMVRTEGTVQWQPIKISFYDSDLVGNFGADDESLALGIFNTARFLLTGIDFGDVPDQATLAKGSKLALAQLDGAENNKSIKFSQIEIYKFIDKKAVILPTSEGIAPGAATVIAKLAQVWTIKSPILTGINFGELDYGSEDTNLITIDLEYDSCTLTTQNIID